MSLYTAKSLDDVAALFEEKSRIARRNASASRTQKEANKWSTEATTWRDAAEILRNTTITRE